MSSKIFASSANIQIRLTRNDDESQDDRIVIKYKDEDIYQLFFRDGGSLTSVTYCTVLTGEELDIYMESLFTLLSRDRDPFRSIEFQIPCFPTLQYHAEDMSKGKIRGALRRVMPILYAAAKY
jgi:hypothetical protein